LDVEKPTVPIFSWSLGVYDSDFLAIHEDRGKRVKEINALVHSFGLTVVNDRRSPDRISSVDHYLSLRCYFGILRGSFLFVQGSQDLHIQVLFPSSW
jgi:hypothetical protein